MFFLKTALKTGSFVSLGLARREVIFFLQLEIELFLIRHEMSLFQGLGSLLLFLVLLTIPVFSHTFDNVLQIDLG